LRPARVKETAVPKTGKPAGPARAGISLLPSAANRTRHEHPAEFTGRDPMHRSRVVTVWYALATTVAALVTSAALALPAAAVTATQVPRTARPAATGNFTPWPQAQTAAGFALHRPTSLHGLRRAGPVTVRRCEVRGQHRKRVASAVYGTPFSA